MHYTDSLIKAAKKKRVLRVVLLMAVGLIVWFGLFVARYRSGANYSPVHVMLDVESSELRSIVVKTISPFGTEGQLVPHEKIQGVWNASDSIGPVKAIAVLFPESISAPGIVRYHCGEFTEKFEQQILSLSKPVTVALGGGLRRVIYEPDIKCSSVFSVARKTLNWQGDFALILASGFWAVLILGSLWGAFRLFRLLVQANKQANVRVTTERVCGKKGMKARMISELDCLFYVVVLIVLLHHAWGQLPLLLGIQDVYHIAAAVGIIGGLSVALSVYVKIVNRQSSDRGITRVALLIIGTVLVLKIVWSWNVNSVQIGDYGIYWKYGKTMAQGSWGDLAGASPLQEILVDRAFLFTFPAAYLGAGNPVAIKIMNLILECGALYLLYVFASNIFNRRVAAISLPFLAIYPDLWFGVTLAMHDIPAHFWLVLFFLLFESTRRALVPLEAGGFQPKKFGRVALFAMAAGLVASILEVQRSYGPILVGAIVLYAVYIILNFKTRDFAFEDQPETRGFPSRRLMTKIIVIMFIILAMFGATSSLKAWIREMAGPFDRDSIVGYVTSVESESDAKWNEMHPWRWQYYPAVPDKEKCELGIRKVIYEKLASPAAFWRHLVRKDREISGSDFGMVQALGGSDGDYFPKWSRIHNLYLNRFLCGAATLVLIGFSLMRLLLLPALPVAAGEIMPLLFCSAGMAILLGLSEAVAPYDMFLAFPLAWSAGLTIAHLSKPSGSQAVDRIFPEKENPEERIFSVFLKRTGRGFGVIGVIAAVHFLTGNLARNMGAGFRSLHVKSLSESGTAGSRREAKVIVDPVTASVTFPERGDGIIPAGTSVAAHFELNGTQAMSSAIRFFVSGDQRRMRQTEPLRWEAIPASFKVLVDGVAIYSGALRELEKPKFFVVPVQNTAGISNHCITIELDSSGDWNQSNYPYPPALAIEYVY